MGTRQGMSAGITHAITASVPNRSRPKDVNDFQPQGIIVNPHALPMYRDENYRGRKRKVGKGYLKARNDPGKTRKPEMPVVTGTKGKPVVLQWAVAGTKGRPVAPL